MQDLNEMELVQLNESTVYDLMQSDEYAGLTTQQLMDIWSFSADWRRLKKRMDVCKMTVPFSSSADMMRFITAFRDSGTFNGDAEKASQGTTLQNLGSNGPSMQYSVKINRAWQSAIMQAVMQVWPYKISGITFAKSQNDDKWVMSVNTPDESVVATTWAIYKAAKATSEDQDLRRSFMQMVKDVVDADPKIQIGKAKLQVFTTSMDQKFQSMYANITNRVSNSPIVNSIEDLPDREELKQILTKTANQNQGQTICKLMLTGSFDNLKTAFGVLLNKNPKENGFTAEENAKFNQVCVPVAFDESTPEMKHLVKMVKNDVASGEFQNADEVVEFMKSKKFGIAATNLDAIASMTKMTNADNKRQREDGVENVPDDVEVQDILAFNSVKKLIDEYGEQDGDENGIEQRIASHEWAVPDPSTLAPEGAAQAGNAIVQRRLKLFEDIQKLREPAKVYKYGHWICAVCYTRAQAYFWTRTKPKAYASGPKIGQMIKYTNMRDDELQALVASGELTDQSMQMYKDIRDFRMGSGATRAPKLYEEIDGQRVKLEYTNVKDGLKLRLRGSNDTTDDLYGEAYWCTAGALDIDYRCHGWNFEDNVPEISYWKSYNRIDGGRNPYWVIMDLNNGVLYQHSRYIHGSGALTDDCLSEADMETDIHGRQLGSCSAETMAAAFLGEHDYAAMMNDLRNDAQTAKTRELKKSIQVTNDGFVTVTSKQQIEHLKPLFSTVDGYHKIRLVGNSWTYGFNGFNVKFLTHVAIEGTNVDVSDLFNRAEIADVLTIEGLENATNTERMFKSCKNANIIKGINLDNTRSCSEMFRDCKTHHNLDLYLEGNFNMQKCSNIECMFYKSQVVSINLRNTQNIKNAKAFFKYCTRLKQFPDVKFPYAKNSFDSVFGFSYETAIINPLYFAWTIRTPFKVDRRRAQAWLQETLEYYKPSSASDIKFTTKNGRRLIVVDNRDSTFIQRVLNMLHEDYTTGRGEIDGLTIENITDGDNLFSTNHIDYDNVKGSKSGGDVAYPRLMCEVFDFGSLKRAQKIFYGLDLNGISEFIGTEGLEDASYLFYYTSLAALPRLSFPNAKTAKLILGSTTTLDRPPEFVFSYKCQTDFSGTNDGYYNLFGEADQSSIESRIGVNRAMTAMRRMQSSIDQSKLQRLAELLNVDENGTATINKSQAQDLLVLGTFYSTDMKDHVKTLVIDEEDASFMFSCNKSQDSNMHRLKWMPTLDMAKVKNCSNMFEGMLIYGKIQMVNTSRIASCKQMFHCSTIVTDDTSWIQPLIQFENCTTYSGFMKSVNMETDVNISIDMNAHVTNIDEMFSWVRNAKIHLSTMRLQNPNCSAVDAFYSTRVVAGDELVVDAKNCLNMFEYARLYDVKSISVLNAESCVGMFQSSTFDNVNTLKKIDIPTALTIDNMFNGMTSVNGIVVGQINAPNATSAAGMFAHAGGIMSICFLNIDHLYDQNFVRQNMFAGSGLRNVYGNNGQNLIEAKQAFEQLAQAAQEALAQQHQQGQAAQPEQQPAA